MALERELSTLKLTRFIVIDDNFTNRFKSPHSFQKKETFYHIC